MVKDDCGQMGYSKERDKNENEDMGTTFGLLTQGSVFSNPRSECLSDPTSFSSNDSRPSTCLRCVPHLSHYFLILAGFGHWRFSLDSICYHYVPWMYSPDLQMT